MFRAAPARRTCTSRMCSGIAKFKFPIRIILSFPVRVSKFHSLDPHTCLSAPHSHVNSSLVPSLLHKTILHLKTLVALLPGAKAVCIHYYSIFLIVCQFLPGACCFILSNKQNHRSNLACPLSITLLSHTRLALYQSVQYMY